MMNYLPDNDDASVENAPDENEADQGTDLTRAAIETNRNLATKIYYLGTDSSKVLVVKVNNETGSLVEIIQTVDTPNPRNLPSGSYNGVSTEWISKHPKHSLLYVLTSYWNLLEGCVTTFKISKKRGTLTKLSERSTGGYHAAYATFSPDNSLYVIAHHNDGKLAFFDCRDNDALDSPILEIKTPEAVPGTKREVGRKDACPGLPSLHHVQYSPNKKYLLTVDPSQDFVFTYPVDDRGLPKSKVPTSMCKCHSDYPIYGIFQRLVTQYVLRCSQRARKARIHPNGKYVYVLFESINRIQNYGIDEDGKIDGNNCLQDLSALDPYFTASSYYPVGITLQLAAELHISKDGSTLILSNRGDKKLIGSRAENSIRVFDIQQDGRVLVPKGAIPSVRGPVRHFVMEDHDQKIVAAVCHKDRQCLQTFQKQGSQHEASRDSTGYELVGEAMVGANVFCIAH